MLKNHCCLSTSTDILIFLRKTVIVSLQCVKKFFKIHKYAPKKIVVLGQFIFKSIKI